MIEIVAIEPDVEFPYRDMYIFELGDRLGQLTGDGNAPGMVTSWAIRRMTRLTSAPSMTWTGRACCTQRSFPASRDRT
jgi:hypothetical protein